MLSHYNNLLLIVPVIVPQCNCCLILLQKYCNTYNVIIIVHILYPNHASQVSAPDHEHRKEVTVGRYVADCHTSGRCNPGPLSRLVPTKLLRYFYTASICPLPRLCYTFKLHWQLTTRTLTLLVHNIVWSMEMDRERLVNLLLQVLKCNL